MFILCMGLQVLKKLLKDDVIGKARISTEVRILYVVISFFHAGVSFYNMLE